MALPAVVLLVALALALGAALGAWFVQPPPAPPVVPAPAPEPPAPPHPGLYGRFLPPAQLAAQALHEAPPATPEATADMLAALAADHWSMGVSELRAQLVQGSALPGPLIDALVDNALTALESRHAVGPQARRR